MENVKFEMIDDMLHIVVDPSVNLGPTKSGKSDGIAKTGGWGVEINAGGQAMTISLNAYKPRSVAVAQGEVTVG